MADPLAGHWDADATGIGELLPADRVASALPPIHALNVRAQAAGRTRSTKRPMRRRASSRRSYDVA